MPPKSVNGQLAAAEPTRAEPQVRHTVLCVDDQEVNRYVRTKAFLGAGFEVMEAPNGTEALRIAIEKHPALVVLDVRLPDLNGFEVCERLKTDPRTRAIPVLHITALGRLESDLPVALEHKSDVYLREPVEPETLVATANALIRASEDRERLRLANEQHARLFNLVHEGFAHYRAVYDDAGRLVDLLVLEINPAGARLFGVAREDQIGRTWRHVWPGVDESLFAKYQQADESGEPVRFDDHNLLTGRIHDVVISRIEPGEFIVTFSDITERKRAEEAANQSRAKLESVLERYEQQLRLFDSVASTTPDFVYLFDRQGRFLYANRRLLEVWGMELPEVVGKTCRELGYEQWHHDMHMREIAQVIETKKPIKGDVPFKAPLTGIFGVYEYIFTPVIGPDGEVEIIAGTTRDVTERKRAEQAVRDSEARLRATIQSIVDEVWITDAQGRVVLVSDAVSENLGAPKDHWRDIYSALAELETFYADGTPRPSEEAPLARCLRGEVLRRELERVRHLATGELLWREVSGAPLCGPDGRITGAVAVIRDITEQKRAHEALREANEEAQRMRNLLAEGQRIAHLGSFEYVAATQTTVWSEEEYRIHGLDPAGPSPSYAALLADCIHPEDAALLDRVFQAAMKDCSTYELEHRIVRPDGSVRWVHDRAQPYFDQSGNLVRYVGTTLDVTERKAAEEALRLTQASVDHAAELVAWIAPDARLQYANDATCRSLGYSREELLEMTSLDFTAGLTWEQHLQFFEEIRKRKSFTVELTHRRKDGAEYPVEVLLNHIVYGGQEYIFAYGKDITERKRAENALRESEARLRLALDAARMTAWEYDPATRKVAFSENAEKVLELPQRHENSDQGYNLIHPDDVARHTTLVTEAIATGGSYVSVYRRSHAQDEHVIWLEEHGRAVVDQAGKTVRLVGVVQNITSRKRAEQALRDSEMRERARARELEAILDAAPVAIFISQDPECRNIIGNKLTYDFGRLHPGAIVSKSAPAGQAPATFRAMRHGRDIQPEDLPGQKAASTGRPVRNYEFDIVYEDGACRNLLGDAVPLFGEDGKPRGAVGAFVDITERKRTEERLRQTQKLESIGLLAGGIAHDFNNLLTGVLGNASLLLEDAAPDRADMLRSIIAGAERAAHLTKQLLAYSGKGQFFVRELDVSQAVHETADLVQFSIPKSVGLSLNLVRRLPSVEMDPGQLQQILMNLVINAGEAIGEGNPGRITVATSVADISAPFTDELGSEIAPGRYVSIEVSDTGSGIDPETKPKIFDPFFTTKFVGRGLGLAAVAGIIRTQNGGIIVESAQGKGTTFRVLLPVVFKNVGRVQDPAQGGGATVLVIDDETSVRDFIGSVLRRKGYHVLQASDGLEALAMCGSAPGAISAAIVDIVMPNMATNELLPALKLKQPGMRILLTSGYSESEARRFCAACPGAAFIQKPYTAQQLATVLGDLLAGSGWNAAAL